jgi:hypothetical protein
MRAVRGALASTEIPPALRLVPAMRAARATRAICVRGAAAVAALPANGPISVRCAVRGRMAGHACVGNADCEVGGVAIGVG